MTQLRYSYTHLPVTSEIPKGDAPTRYGKLRKVLIDTLGTDFTSQDDLPDSDRLTRHRGVLRELRSQLKLPISENQMEIMSLMYVSLSYANRFEGTAGMHTNHGETPVKHSMHAALDLYRDMAKTLQPEGAQAFEALSNKTLYSRGITSLLMHDADEVFGEPTTVHSRAQSGQDEQDPNAGIKVLHYALQIAAAAAERKKAGDKNAYADLFKQYQAIRDMADVKKVGYVNILRYMKAHPAPEISDASQADVNILMYHYALAEGVEKPFYALLDLPVDDSQSEDRAFARNLIKLYDRSEGSAHYNRFIEGHTSERARVNYPRYAIEASRADNTPDRMAKRFLNAQALPMDSKMMMANLAYTESKIVDVLQSAHTDAQKELAKQAVNHCITRIIQTLSHSPFYIDRFAKDFILPKGENRILQSGEFNADQANLQAQNRAERAQGKRTKTEECMVRNFLPRVVDRRELISAYQQLRAKINEGWVPQPITYERDGKEVTFNGLLVAYPAGVTLPEGVNLNKPVQMEAGVSDSVMEAVDDYRDRRNHAAKLAKERGAAVITMTHNPNSICAQEDMNPVVYSWEDDTNEKERPQGIVMRVLNELMKLQEPSYTKYEAVLDGLEKADGIVRAAVKKVQNRTWVFAEKYFEEPFLYIMGSGASYSQAYGFSICSLQEMQWMDCCYLHSGEYFHGPFECTDEDHLYILLMGTGAARVMDERALTFLKKYGKKYEVIDAKELGIDAIDESVNEYFCPMVFYAMSVAYRTGLQDKRRHPLDMRRYMGVVEY